MLLLLLLRGMEVFRVGVVLEVGGVYLVLGVVMVVVVLDLLLLLLLLLVQLELLEGVRLLAETSTPKPTLMVESPRADLDEIVDFGEEEE